MTDLQLAWAAAERNMAAELPPTTMHIWIAPLKLVAIEADAWVIEAPSHIRTWVRDRYAGAIAAAAAAATGQLVAVRIVPPGHQLAPRPRRGTTLGVTAATQ